MTENTNNNQGCGWGCGCLSFIVAIIIAAFRFSLWLGTILLVIIIGFCIFVGVSDDKKSESEVQNPEDAKEILENVAKGEIKDPVTQEIFQPGEKVYLCDIHLLAYHEDSWDEVGCKCMECGNDDNTKEYTVPKLNEKQLTATEST